jgi:hypothetical protein
MGELAVIKKALGCRLHFGIVQKYVLVKEDGFKKEAFFSTHKNLDGFVGPTHTDYAEALELIAKQLRELKL